MKLRSAIAVLLVAAVASFASAQTVTQLFDWENDVEGWDFVTNTDGYSFDNAVGVTSGSYSVMIDVQDGWKQGLTRGWDWAPFFNAMTEGNAAGDGVLKLDVTTSNAMLNVPMTSGIQLACFIQGESGGGGGMFNYTISYELIMASYAAELTTETVEWSCVQTSDGTPMSFPTFDESTGGWAEMRLHTNVIGGATNAGFIWIDNMRVEFSGISCIPGDANCDGTVDIADYTVWADNFGGSGPDGDLNNDGIVDIADYTVWADNFGNTAVVPEPATMTLLGLGAVALMRRRRS